MAWFEVARGLYYLIGIGEKVLGPLLGAGDGHATAVPAIGSRPTVNATRGYGLITAQGGLFSDQDVDQSLWRTKVPLEYKFKRQAIPQNFIDDFDAYSEWVRSKHDYLKGPGKDAAWNDMKNKLGGELPPFVDFYIMTTFRDLGEPGNNAYPNRTIHRFHLDNTFLTNDLVDFEAKNNPTVDTERGVVADANGNLGLEPVSATAPQKGANPTSEKWTQTAGEPMVYGIIDPRNMGFGIPAVSYFDEVDLAFEMHMMPVEATTSVEKLIMFFAHDDPREMNFRLRSIDSVPESQRIDYSW